MITKFHVSFTVFVIELLEIDCLIIYFYRDSSYWRILCWYDANRVIEWDSML